MPDGEDAPYLVGEHQGTYAVVDTEDQVVCVCGSERNAEHYLVLLKKAYRRGYKAGYRAGKLTVS